MATLAPLYARLLAREAGQEGAALQMLARTAAVCRDPDVAALQALMLLRLGRPPEASARLQTALADHAVRESGLLACIATELIEHPAVTAPGWIGRSPALDLVGVLSSRSSARSLELCSTGEQEFARTLHVPRTSGIRAFRLPSPDGSVMKRIQVTQGDAELLGSGCLPPPDFHLDGRVEVRAHRLIGWARLGWHPQSPLELRIEDESGRTIRTRTDPHSSPPGTFNIDVARTRIVCKRLEICARLPDGRWHALPESPWLEARAIRGQGPKPRPLAARRFAACAPAASRWRPTPARGVTIVIPVHDSREHALACIDSVMASVERTIRIVVIDDASRDTALIESLDALAASGRIELLRNAQNLGFVGTVSRGIAQHPDDDVVLLNSDTQVFGDWMTRLRAAAYSGPRVATVTPWSNAGSIVSYPTALGGSIDAGSAQAFQALVAATHPERRFELPVGVGFCLYLRRDGLDEIGELDAAVFGRGYGEETDFCLRASALGWSNRLAADVYVYHAGGASFGAQRAALLERAARLINVRHPGYDRLIRSFLTQDPLRGPRRSLDERRLLEAGKCRSVLILSLALGGGVDRFVQERCRAINARGLLPVILKPRADDRTVNARECGLSVDGLDLPNLRYRMPADLPALMELLRKLELAGLELQHFLHLYPPLIEAIRGLGVPYDVHVHDYAWICPRVTLMDGSGRYCGEPALRVCEDCVRRNGSHIGEALSVRALRARSGRWLRGARAVHVPSRDAQARLRRYFEDLDSHVEPRPTPSRGAWLPALQPADPPSAARTIRVALIGAIGQHKGYRVLWRCARQARARRLPLEFTVIGYTEDDDPLLATGRVFITGRYSEEELPHLLRRERPDLVWLPSVTPETWCYALDSALQSGLPIAAFDLGAIAERLRGLAGTRLMPLSLSPAQINQELLTLARAPQGAGLQTSVESATDGRAGDAILGLPETESSMSTRDSPAIKPGITASVRLLSLPAGLHLFSVPAGTSRLAGPSPGAGSWSLPAALVAPGPGVSGKQVEFVAGPSGEGSWLLSPGDLLVCRVLTTAATVVLTSLQAPDGSELDVQVRALDGRAGAASDAAAPVAAPTQMPRDPRERTATAALALQVAAHIRTRGDITFTNMSWAGRVAPGLWIEAFSVKPTEQLLPQEVEYKGFTGSGFETPWITDAKMCGTRGMSVPLVGFAVRLKPGAATADYDCEYSGYFQSGVTVGPVRNGAPCRSTVANDPLEGLQIRFIPSSDGHTRAAQTPAKVHNASAVRSTSERRKRVRKAPPRRPTRGSVRRTAARDR